jgi:hypothetical protein
LILGGFQEKKSQENFFLVYNATVFVLSLCFPEKFSNPGLTDAGNGTITLDINNTILYHNIITDHENMVAWDCGFSCNL